MSNGLQIPKKLACISQPRRSCGLLLALTAPEFLLCNSPSCRSPKARFFAWRDADGDWGNRSARLTHSLLLQPDLTESRHGTAAVWVHRRPERDGSLQTGVSVKRHPSSYFPCSPSVTRSVLVPRPAARRGSTKIVPDEYKTGPHLRPERNHR
jgi:hypothetical protein